MPSSDTYFKKGHTFGKANKGKKRPDTSERNWKGGITPINIKLRMSLEYQEWRKRVFMRDDYTCQICGIVGEYFHADHIKSFSEYPELRFELSNGRTLCVPCHFKITFGKTMIKDSKWGHQIYAN